MIAMEGKGVTSAPVREKFTYIHVDGDRDYKAIELVRWRVA